MANVGRLPCDAAAIQAAAGPATSRRAGTWVLVATILGSSMAFIDMTLVNVALPEVQSNLNAGAAAVQWVVEIYALFLSSLLLLGGSVGDRFGRRASYVAGTALFGLASLGCALAPNVGLLILARAVQGIGGALLVPGSLALISAAYPKDERGGPIGLWSAWTSIAAGLGPAAGGWVIQHSSWRAAFLLNVPFAIVVVAVMLARVGESRDEAAPRALDWWGSATVTVGLGAVVYGLIESSDLGFGDRRVQLSLLLGLCALLAFVLLEARVAAPMAPPALFRSPTFTGTNLLTFFLYAALGGALFFVPFLLIQVRGYSPAGAGAAFLPFTLLLFALSRWAGGLVGRVGAKLPLTVGPLITAAGFALLALPGLGGTYWTTYFLPMALLGAGMGVAVAPLTTAVLGAVQEQYAGVAAAINNAVSRVAGLLAVAVFGIVVVHQLKVGLDRRLAALPLSPALRHAIAGQPIKLGGIVFPPGAGPAVRAGLQAALNQAFLDGFRIVMLLSAGLAVLSAVIALLMVEGKQASVQTGQEQSLVPETSS